MARDTQEVNGQFAVRQTNHGREAEVMSRFVTLLYIYGPVRRVLVRSGLSFPPSTPLRLAQIHSTQVSFCFRFQLPRPFVVGG